MNFGVFGVIWCFCCFFGFKCFWMLVFGDLQGSFFPGVMGFLEACQCEFWCFWCNLVFLLFFWFQMFLDVGFW